MNIDILVDYDNIPKLERGRGMEFIANRIINSIPNTELLNKKRVRIRLYGGWYTQGNITHKAQNLAVDVQTNFPRIISQISTGFKILVNTEIAYSLLIAPSEHIFNTYRIRPFPTDLKCDDPANHGCNDVSCPVRHVYMFLTHDRCNNQCCSIKPKDIIYRGEQKLVDNMITCDLFYLTKIKSQPLVIVTSDEDFWPSFRSIIAMNSKLIHVQTRSNRQTPQYYVQNANSNYLQVNL